MKTPIEYEIISHGFENSQYFQGCGVAFTQYVECHTGIGNTEHEAIEDALDLAAQCDWDTTNIPNNGDDEYTIEHCLRDVLGDDGYKSEYDDGDAECDVWYYASVRVR